MQHRKDPIDIYVIPVTQVIKQTGDKMGWAGGSHGGRRVACRVFVRKPEGKRPLGRPRHR